MRTLRQCLGESTDHQSSTLKQRTSVQSLRQRIAANVTLEGPRGLWKSGLEHKQGVKKGDPKIESLFMLMCLTMPFTGIRSKSEVVSGYWQQKATETILRPWTLTAVYSFKLRGIPSSIHHKPVKCVHVILCLSVCACAYMYSIHVQMNMYYEHFFSIMIFIIAHYHLNLYTVRCIENMTVIPFAG